MGPLRTRSRRPREVCCRARGIPARLDFDGRDDSINQALDEAGNQYMEYLQLRGEYADVPIDEIVASFGEKYAALMLDRMRGDFDREVEEDSSLR